MIGKWWFDVVCMEWEMDHNMPRQVHQKATRKTMCPWKSGRPKTLIMGSTKFLIEILRGGSTGPAWHEIAWAVVVLCCFVHIQYCCWLLSPSVHRPLSLVWSAWHFHRCLPLQWLYQPWLLTMLTPGHKIYTSAIVSYMYGLFVISINLCNSLSGAHPSKCQAR